jgi:hypothetical protein
VSTRTAVADHRYIVSFALDISLAQRQHKIAVGHFADFVEDLFRFEEDHRIIAANRGLQQSLGVGGR